MQAHIRFNKSIRATLHYHEQKQKLGMAECLVAGNFLKELRDLDIGDKLYHLQRLATLNEAVTNRVLHIALTFHPTQMLSNQQMIGLSEEYLERMKLAHQPYLVYRHNDTLHPHMHVMLAGVQKDATRVHLTPADFHESWNIVREITLKHQLVQSLPAEETRKRQVLKIKYGEMALRPSINNVLNKVLSQYKYPHLEGLNAILRLYNLQAFRGKEGSDMYLHRGLVLRVLDEGGRPLHGCFKASWFDGHPTLDKLEKRMAETLKEGQRQQHRQRVTTMLEWNITKKSMDMPMLEKALQREQITMVWMKEDRGQGQKLFFVDHSNRTVFDGNELGSGYDATALRQRLPQTQVQEQKQELQHRHRHRLRYEL